MNSPKECNSLAEEVFCLKYELSLLAGQVMGRGLERWIEDFSPIHVQQEHQQRYQFACGITRGLKVLDIACGTGRGSRMLAEEGGAASVLGCDIDQTTVQYATLRNGGPNVSFQSHDALLPLEGAKFDVIVSFETIEHVTDPSLFVSNLASSLNHDGVLLISTPVSQLELDKHPVNPFHVQEWGTETFRQLLDSRLTVRRTHFQYRPKESPTLLKRIAIRLFGRSISGSPPASAMPCWITRNGDEPNPDLPKFSYAYQIFECCRA